MIIGIELSRSRAVVRYYDKLEQKIKLIANLPEYNEEMYLLKNLIIDKQSNILDICNIDFEEVTNYFLKIFSITSEVVNNRNYDNEVTLALDVDDEKNYNTLCDFFETIFKRTYYFTDDSIYFLKGRYAFIKGYVFENDFKENANIQVVDGSSFDLKVYNYNISSKNISLLGNYCIKDQGDESILRQMIYNKAKDKSFENLNGYMTFIKSVNNSLSMLSSLKQINPTLLGCNALDFRKDLELVNKYDHNLEECLKKINFKYDYQIIYRYNEDKYNYQKSLGAILYSLSSIREKKDED